MFFTSFQFLIFFPIVVFLYFFIPYRYRWSLLLIASYYFYMAWNPAYVVLLITSTLVDYYAAILMGKTPDKRKRKKYLWGSLFCNLGLLFVFKYFNFFNDTVRQIFQCYNYDYRFSGLNVLLPIGISFYTFQTLSYAIDVYRGAREPEKHFGIFAVYVSFFPQLVAGPIERSKNLLPQFREKHSFNYKLAASGLKLMAWGYFKKLVIADRLAIVVNMVYNDPSTYKGLPLILATVFFAFQIFCDFSGYSDIAIGAARVMGYRLMRNFKRPYFATSVSEFWRRWHISLSSWIHDYIYMPLVVKYRYWGKAGVISSLIITFTLMGLWHGAGWAFVLFGLLNGIAVSYNVLTGKIWRKISKNIPTPVINVFCILSTFSFWCFSLIFFRANSINDAFYIIRNLLSGISNIFSLHSIRLSLFGLGLGTSGPIIIASIALLGLVHFLQERGKSITSLLEGKPLFVRLLFYYGLILSIIIFGVFESSKFIYFQF